MQWSRSITLRQIEVDKESTGTPKFHLSTIMSKSTFLSFSEVAFHHWQNIPPKVWMLMTNAFSAHGKETSAVFSLRDRQGRNALKHLKNEAVAETGFSSFFSPVMSNYMWLFTRSTFEGGSNNVPLDPSEFSPVTGILRPPFRGGAVDKRDCDIFDVVAAKSLSKEGLNRFVQDRTTITALNDRLVKLIELVRTNTVTAPISTLFSLCYVPLCFY